MRKHRISTSMWDKVSKNFTTKHVEAELILDGGCDNMQLYDYICKLRHKTLHFYVCYHALSEYLSFHTILRYNIKIHYFRDNYTFLNYIF